LLAEIPVIPVASAAIPRAADRDPLSPARGAPALRHLL